MRKSLGWVLGPLVAASAIVSCGGESATEKPLTEAQVQLIANAFYRNHTAGGIVFALSTPSTTGNGTIAIEGVVDFVKVAGRARVVGGAAPHPVTGVIWGGQSVLEYRPTLRPSLDSLGFPDAQYVARQIDMKARRLDVLLSSIMGMGADQPENAVLVRQREGSAFLRNDELRGTKVEVLRYGDRLIFWVDPVTGDVLRFEGTNTARTFPIVIDFLGKGPQTVEMPFAAQVVEADKLGTAFVDLAPQSP